MNIIKAFEKITSFDWNELDNLLLRIYVYDQEDIITVVGIPPLDKENKVYILRQEIKEERG